MKVSVLILTRSAPLRQVCVLNIEDKGKRDEELFEEEYTKLKGQTDEQKYALIPKFYSKVPQHML